MARSDHHETPGGAWVVSLMPNSGLLGIATGERRRCWFMWRTTF